MVIIYKKQLKVKSIIKRKSSLKLDFLYEIKNFVYTNFGDIFEKNKYMER